MDYRLDKHLQTSVLKQKQQLWSQTAKNGLQLVILTLLLVVGLGYYSQVAGLKFVYDEGGKMQGLQFVKSAGKEAELLPAFERDRCRELLTTRDNAREELVTMRGEHAAVAEALKAEKMQTQELTLTNTRLTKELHQRSSTGRDLTRLEADLASEKERATDAAEQSGRYKEQLAQATQAAKDARAEHEGALAELRRELEKVEGERDQLKVEAEARQAELRKDSSAREASLVETVATLKDELKEADAACHSKTETLSAEVGRLSNSTATNRASSQALRTQLAEERQQQQAVKDAAEQVKQEAAEAVTLANAQRDELKARNAQLEPQLKKLQSTVDFLTTQACETPNAAAGADGADGAASKDATLIASLKAQLAEAQASGAAAGSAGGAVRLQLAALSAAEAARGQRHLAPAEPRLQRLAQKLVSGAGVSVGAVGGWAAAAGGAVAPSKHYLALLQKWLTLAFPSGLHKVHAAAPDGKTALGATNVCADTLLGDTPLDLIVLEGPPAAVPGNASLGERLALERLLRKLLRRPEAPAVVLAPSFRWRQEDDALSVPGLSNLALFHSAGADPLDALAQYYNLPEVAVRDAVWAGAARGDPGRTPASFVQQCSPTATACRQLAPAGHAFLADLLQSRLHHALTHLHAPVSEAECGKYPTAMEVASQQLDPYHPTHLIQPTQRASAAPKAAPKPAKESTTAGSSPKPGPAAGAPPRRVRADRADSAEGRGARADRVEGEGRAPRAAAGGGGERERRSKEEPPTAGPSARAGAGDRGGGDRGGAAQPSPGLAGGMAALPPRPEGVSRQKWKERFGLLPASGGRSDGRARESRVAKMAREAGLARGTGRRHLRRLLQAPLEEGAVCLPPPMYPGNWGLQPGRAACFPPTALRALIVDNQGWEYTQEEGAAAAGGWAAFREGATLDLALDTTAPAGAGPVGLVLKYRRAAQHMGAASMECVQGCTCTALQPPAAGGETPLLVEAQGPEGEGAVVLAATQHKRCVVRFTLARSSSAAGDGGGLKFKLLSVLRAEYPLDDPLALLP